MSVNAYIKEQIAYQERIRELEGKVAMHRANWQRMDAAAKRYVTKIDELDDENKRLREAIAEVNKAFGGDIANDYLVDYLTNEQEAALQALEDKS